MFKKKGYVNLKGGWKLRSRENGLWFIPQNPVVQLGGRIPRRPTGRLADGVPLQGTRSEEQLPGSSLERLLYSFLSGLAVVLVFLGIFNLIGKDRGKQLGSSL